MKKRDILILAVIALVLLLAIAGVVALVNFLFRDASVLGENKIYELWESYHTLDIEISAGNLELQLGDRFILDSNYSYLKVETKDGVLRIYDDLPAVHPTNFEGVKILLIIPKDHVFQTATVTTGAGVVQVQKLSAKQLEMKLGAGEVTIQELFAEHQSKITGGAGEITIRSGNLQNLDLDMGVGQLNLTAALTGKCTLDQGVGELNLTLMGRKQDYFLAVTKGLGDIRIDGESVANDSTFGIGDHKVTIHGGIGAINIAFDE